MTAPASIVVLLVTGFALACFASPARAQDQPPRRDDRRNIPILVVSGSAEVSVKPDRAVVQLGAIAQAPDASAAQQRVNQIMESAIEAIRESGIAPEQISTAGISLHPVYTDRRPPPRPLPGAGEDGGAQEPRIIAYRASNRLRIRVDQLDRVGEVIDAGVNSGANIVESVSFELKDDTQARADALQAAVKQARAKAEAMASAMNLKLDGVLELGEGGVQLVRPHYDFARGAVAAAPMEVGTPVQPGQLNISATVNVTYRVSPTDGAER